LQASDAAGSHQISALPMMIGVLCVLAIAYRYYSAFIAARVMVLDDSRETPAHTMNDGQNYFPTNKWVLFGHHFAAIAGPGPLVGPVLAAQFGYLPGTLWIILGAVFGMALVLIVWRKRVRRRRRTAPQEGNIYARSWQSAQLMLRAYELPFGVFLGGVALAAIFVGGPLIHWYVAFYY